ncbi:N4-gp56 family major capsid protein [Roseateles sp. SL47]|uniref:N4-gp56 family major capsid protein n=1 Tax=Roseateles sp. SL47 TaxID=2995138 RepID=UPI00226E23A8|nr:N4-gp56 family major capsid protein [Roseateles sp. SL47]WAC72078.1 N4-gp56 family major capsid protein [Roseateles sp. SL47]
MARTQILPTDPNKRRAWSATVAQDSIKEQYFARMMGEEGTPSAIIRKVDTEAGGKNVGNGGNGDEVTTALVAKLRGEPVTEGKKLEGAEFRLQHASHTMRINEFRHGVNIGARIDQARVGFNLKKQGRERLTDYIKEMYDEVTSMAVSGARGTGDEIQHFGLNYAGYPNALRAPDAAHLFVGTSGSATKASLVATDKMNLSTINKLRTKSRKMLGGQPDKAVKMTPIVKNGKKAFILACLPEVIQDIRDDVGAAGWFEAQKALTNAIGKESEIFKGGAGWFNGVLVDEIETGVKFNDYGAGANIGAARSLFMGASAGALAHGTKGQADGLEVQLDESEADHGHEKILFFEMIFGADKCQYNGMDYGVISVDTAFTPAV